LKILLYTDLAIRPDQLFWHRDLGLLTKAFRNLGHDAYLVVHPAVDPLSKIKYPTSKIREEPVLWASSSQVRDKEWWKNHHPDLVILGLWTRPKYDPIRRAALSATPRVIERADSDGMRTASCGFFTYAKRRFDYFRDRTYHWPPLLSIPASIFYSFASICATPWIETRLARTLKLLPAIAVETPPAALLWKSLATRLGINPKKIHCVPHPIQTDLFKFDPAIQKKNQIISVGRWDSYQKNLPLLLKTLRTFLDENPSWTSLVIGSGLPPKSPHPRITFLPPTSPVELAPLMQESKIFLSSSRYESFGLAAAEALCCGCVTQGPHGLESPHYFRSLIVNPHAEQGLFLFSGRPTKAPVPLASDTIRRVSELLTPAKIAQQICEITQSLGKPAS
jgi:glycosyltransferase involved in cell wall biosynthesis